MLDSYSSPSTLHRVLTGDTKMIDYDEDLAAYMADDGCETCDSDICPACEGSGEGEFDGAVCLVCRGRGEA